MTNERRLIDNHRYQSIEVSQDDFSGGDGIKLEVETDDCAFLYLSLAETKQLVVYLQQVIAEIEQER